MIPIAFEVNYACSSGLYRERTCGWEVQTKVQDEIALIWKDQLYHNLRRGAVK